MGRLTDLALRIAPSWSAKRERARLIAMHYRAARLGARTDSLRATTSDADRASRDRARIAAYMRDMIRNTPFAARGQAVVANNVVGDGIIPKVEIRGLEGKEELRKGLRDLGMAMIEDNLDTTEIDASGLLNLYGLQRLVINTVFDAGEVLVRRHRFPAAPGKLGLRLEVLEPDYLDNGKWGPIDGGGHIQEGIEYDAEGRRAAYWLYTQHPGGDWRPGLSKFLSERVPAEDILHVFRVDRPGQSRGVSWLAPVAEKLLHFDDYEDAQIMRQKIAACFTAFRKAGSAEVEARTDIGRALEPGLIMDLGPGEEMQFATPPDVTGYDEFTGRVLRASAMGLGLTYEALTGDLTGVNFSSARIGRLEMDRNVTSWQWLMMVPMFLQPLGEWIKDAWIDAEPRLLRVPDFDKVIRFAWVPPVRILVDPAREFAALGEAVRLGFQSRQGVVRQLGVDPERLIVEQLQDKEEADDLGLIFDSDPRSDVARQALRLQDKGKSDE